MKNKIKSLSPAPYIKKETRNKRLEVIFLILVFISSLFVLWGINIYRRTIVEPKYLMGAISFGTISGSVILLYVTKDYLNAFWTIFIATIIGGGTIYFLLLVINKHIASSEITNEWFEIKSSGTLAKSRKRRCRKPYTIINFNGVDKELIFDCTYEKSIHEYKMVSLDYSIGFFGFPYIRNQTLIQ